MYLGIETYVSRHFKVMLLARNSCYDGTLLPFDQLCVVEAVPVRDRVDEDEAVRPGYRVSQGHFSIDLKV